MTDLEPQLKKVIDERIDNYKAAPEYIEYVAIDIAHQFRFLDLDIEQIVAAMQYLESHFFGEVIRDTMFRDQEPWLAFKGAVSKKYPEVDWEEVREDYLKAKDDEL